MAKRFIKLYEQITAWEWYRHPNTLCLFIYLLLKAYYKDTTIGGRVIRRGQLVTSLPTIATDTGLTIRQTRTALSHLVSTGEVTDESSNRYRIITVVKYDDYQTATGESTGNRQAIGRQVDRQTADKLTPYIENIEQIERDRNIELPKGSSRSASRFTPPTKDEVLAFCQENGFNIDVDYLYDYYAAKGWKIGNNSMKDWRAAVRNWARREKKPAEPQQRVKKVVAQDYDQRDYGNAEDGDAMQRMLRMGGF